MRDLTQQEVAAMWLWGAEYARTGLSAIDFYRQLDASRKRVVAEMVDEIVNAAPVAGVSHV